MKHEDEGTLRKRLQEMREKTEAELNASDSAGSPVEVDVEERHNNLWADKDPFVVAGKCISGITGFEIDNLPENIRAIVNKSLSKKRVINERESGCRRFFRF